MFRFAAIQMCSHHIVEDNLALASDLIQKACDDGAQFIALPEGFSHYGLDKIDKLAQAECDGSGRVQEFLANTAVKHQVWLSGGTFLIKDSDEKYYASSRVYDPQGHCVANYNKMHLFRANLPSNQHYSESEIITPGQDYVVFSTPFGRIGLSICFDLRFPELYQKLYRLGAEIILTPSAFTYTTGSVHWEVLLRSRALDTFCFIVAPNQFGTHSNGTQSYGHSMIINPWGEVIHALKSNENGMVLADIDTREVYRCRKTILK